MLGYWSRYCPNVKVMGRECPSVRGLGPRVSQCASSGIGKETARVLASRGARVILACRDRARGVEVENELRAETGSKSIVFMQLDLSSFTSIRQFASEFLTQEQQLHVLINNAGTINANNYQTTEGYELSFGVNHLGHFLLTNLLMDRLNESTPSRVVNVSSLAYRLGVLNFDNLTQSEGRIKSYTRSKLANILFTESWLLNWKTPG
ncbi:putative retinol dehydrogenase 12 [Apostichopus japonicus]|uniref:Putative retinol dehydrogenase 12 n=1 Tax=Stichopus japonicus TaxID=307972 RepID=A0A2G8KFC0_STIJA|nr:putative retinol dehydrogenase 12 [Apostichopus japonicus]